MNEARVRFAQYAVLRCIATTPLLRQTLVFKGGNALDFIWQPNRSTSDLDFSFDPSANVRQITTQGLRDILSRSVISAEAALGILLVVNSVVQQPKGQDKAFVTFRAKIGYALPDQEPLRLRLRQGGLSPHVVEVDVSLNEPIGDATEETIDERHRIRVSTLEDVVAEKLRALLQQPRRNRTRPQDLLDVAVLFKQGANLNRVRVAAFLQAKADARNVPVSRAAFRDPELVNRARFGYDALEATTRRMFVPFDEAVDALYEFVDALPIPDR